MPAQSCVCLWLLVTVSLMGCGGGPVTYEVTGTVSYEGEPVETGEISFIPVESGEAPDGGIIQGGRFAFQAKPGPKRVEIRASRPLPAERQSDPEMGLLYEDYLPAEFNTESRLEAEVSSSNREFNFALSEGGE